MKGQKQAVVDEVLRHLPTFGLYKDIALVMLSNTQLESIKYDIGMGMVNGTIEYSKTPVVTTEAMAYARSMVMNHMKKAKELNGNQVYGKTKTMVEQKKISNRLATVDMESLPDDLKSFVNSIV
jgi:hypothetical protein